MPWEPKKARSATMQICASLLLRPDDVEQEVLLLATAALFNPEVFADEPRFKQFLKTVLMWEDPHIRALIVNMKEGK